MIHASYYKPRVYPYSGDVAPAEIDRVQDMSFSITLNREQVKEVGRDGIVAWRRRTPNQRGTLRQLEYGGMEFWRKLANLGDGETTIDLNDFKTPQVDIAAYQTDDDGTFLGTSWFPKLRVAGFSLNIGDPEANMERSFDLVGEDDIKLQGNNAYFIYLRSAATGTNHSITFGSGAYADYPDPSVDPDNSGVYLLRLLRVRSGVTTELELTTDYTYNSGTGTILIPSSANGDVYKIYYSADDYIDNTSPFTENDSDVASIPAENVSIYLATGNYLYRLQSVGIEVSLDRRDIKEIGNSEIVARGVREKTVRVTLGKLLENYTIEEVLRGVAADYGKIDAREFTDDNTLIVKIYSDSTKSTFLMGYMVENLSPTSLDEGASIDEYITKNVTLEGDALTISSSEGDLS